MRALSSAPEPLVASPRVRAQVDHDEEYRTPRTPNQLHFGMRRLLVVKAAQSLALRAVDRAALHDAHRCAVLGELQLAEGAGEESALVAVALHIDDVGSLESGGGEDHRRSARTRCRSSSCTSSLGRRPSICDRCECVFTIGTCPESGWDAFTEVVSQITTAVRRTCELSLSARRLTTGWRPCPTPAARHLASRSERPALRLSRAAVRVLSSERCRHRRAQARDRPSRRGR